MKTCKKCSGTEFYANGGRCKQCARERTAKYRAENPDRVKKSIALCFEKNGDKYKEARRRLIAENPKIKQKKKIMDAQYYVANAEKIKAKSISYFHKNKQKVYATCAKWRAANPEKVKQYSAKTRASNPEIARIRKINRRARERMAIGKLSKDLAKRLFKLQRGKCACCRTKLGDVYERDHIMPLARGGTNTDDNIQLLCPPCNRKKHVKHPVSFMQSMGFLL